MVQHSVRRRLFGCIRVFNSRDIKLHPGNDHTQHQVLCGRRRRSSFDFFPEHSTLAVTNDSRDRGHSGTDNSPNERSHSFDFSVANSTRYCNDICFKLFGAGLE
jgi:hypothetical protein